MKRFKLSELKKTDQQYWLLNSIKYNHITYYNPVKYQGYSIFDDTGGWGGNFKYVHDDYDGAPDAKDDRHGFGSSIMHCIKKINQYILENEVED